MALSSTQLPNVEAHDAIQESSDTDQFPIDHQASLHEHPTSSSLSLFKKARKVKVKNSQITAIAGNVAFHRNTIKNRNTTRNSYTKNIYMANRDPVSTFLWPHVASGAIFDSAARHAAGRCHPGTREKIIEQILTWIKNPDPIKCISWIYGAAGAGKSALGHTICELLKESHPDEYGASFFFSAESKDRGDASKLFATLAYQLAVRFPSIRSEINKTLASDESLPTKSMEIQLLHLIIRPIQRCRALLSNNPVIIIDGLDECADDSRGTAQAEVIALVSKCIDEYHLPLRFIILSRPEYWIRDAFDAAPLPRITLPISLRDDVDADKDIKAYLTEEFEKIRLKNERFMKSVVAPWPPTQIIDRFVEEASGQYIYAATILKFVGNYSKFSNPQKQLEIITTPGPHRAIAFSELDRLYATILSAYPEWETMKRVLAAFLLDSNITIIKVVLGVDQDELELVLDALSSLIEKSKRKPLSGDDLQEQMLVESIFGPLHDQPGTMSFCHLSFCQFLKDETRSGPFYIDLFTHEAPNEIVTAFFDMTFRNLDQHFETEPHILLNIDIATYHHTMQDATWQSIWYCSFGELLQYITQMSAKLEHYDFGRLAHMHSVFYFIRKMAHFFHALDPFFDDDRVSLEHYENDEEPTEFESAFQRFKQAIHRAHSRAVSSLASCTDFEVTPTLVFLTEYDLTYHHLPVTVLRTIAGVPDAISTLRQHRYILPLMYYEHNQTWRTRTEQSFFTDNYPGPGWRTQAAWKDLRISFAHQSLKTMFSTSPTCDTTNQQFEARVGGHIENQLCTALTRFFNSNKISDINNKEYFQNNLNIAILEVLVMTDLSVWIGPRLQILLVDGSTGAMPAGRLLLVSILSWINRQLKNPQTVALLQDYDDSLQEKLAAALKNLFEHCFLPHFIKFHKKDLCAHSPEVRGEKARSISINVQPLPQGFYEEEMDHSAWESWNDTDYWLTFHDEFFGETAGSTIVIIHPSNWHPHLAPRLLQVLVRVLYGRIHPRFSDDDGPYEESLLYITQCLPYAHPTPENLDALRAIVYLYPQVTPPWNPPERFWRLVLEFLHKYTPAILSSRELALFVKWLNSTEHADIKTYA